MLVIQALSELGQKNVDSQVIDRLKLVLKDEDNRNIEHDAKLAPAWIAVILNELTKSIENDKLA